MRTASFSLRGVVQGALPGARRAMKRARRAWSTAIPEGSPSTTQPTPAECDCPKTVTRSVFPKLEGMVLLICKKGARPSLGRWLDLGAAATQRAEVLEEGGVGLGDALGAADGRGALGARREHGRHHGDAVVVRRVRHAAGQLRHALDHKSVGGLVHTAAERTDGIGDRLKAVGLLDP